MGGGNAQKSAMARQKNLEKAKSAGKGSQLDSNKKAMSIQCKVCMQTFICTTSEVKCREHAEAKHPKADVLNCFPHLKNFNFSELWMRLTDEQRITNYKPGDGFSLR